jgi:cytochrome c553
MKTVLAILLATSLMASTSKCVSCHGTSFEKPALGKSKIVNSMTEQQIVSALKGYKDGSYGGPMKALMKGQVASLSDTDIKTLAKEIKGK